MNICPMQDARLAGVFWRLSSLWHVGLANISQVHAGEMALSVILDLASVYAMTTRRVHPILKRAYSGRSPICHPSVIPVPTLHSNRV